MNSRQQKAPAIADRGCYSVRAIGKRLTAPVALRNTTKTNFEVSRYENSQRV